MGTRAVGEDMHGDVRLRGDAVEELKTESWKGRAGWWARDWRRSRTSRRTAAHPRCEHCGGLQHMVAAIPECQGCLVSESATESGE
ncbi:hypothetical protein ADK53_37195 [Streptomyces sp. WM6373]|nr:hypothetical protein ADK53_37195 [Streptomyces sp. WM6373]KOU89048.1 hypothetical protein ADK61_02125 [Streptomyces sp. XY66]